MARAFDIATSGRPGPVLVDITKDAQLGHLRGPAGWPIRATAHPPCAPGRSIALRVRRTRSTPDRLREAAGDPRRARRARVRRRPPAPRLRRTRGHPGGHHAARHRRLPGLAPPVPRHDRHARRGVREPRGAGGGRDHRDRHAVRRSRRRQRRVLRSAGPPHPRGHRRRPRSTRRSRWTSAIVGDAGAACSTPVLPPRRPADRADVAGRRSTPSAAATAPATSSTCRTTGGCTRRT